MIQFFHVGLCDCGGSLWIAIRDGNGDNSALAVLGDPGLFLKLLPGILIPPDPIYFLEVESFDQPILAVAAAQNADDRRARALQPYQTPPKVLATSPVLAISPAIMASPEL